MAAADGRFPPPGPADVARLIDRHLLGWLVSAAGGEFQATLLPLRARFDPTGQVTELKLMRGESTPTPGSPRGPMREFAGTSIAPATGPHSMQGRKLS